MEGKRTPADELGDELTYAYSMLESIAKNLPDSLIEEEWRDRYNAAIHTISEQWITGFDKYQIPESYFKPLYGGRGDSLVMHTSNQFRLMLDAALIDIRLRMPKETVQRAMGFPTGTR